MENNGGMILTREIPAFSTRALCQSYQQSFSSKQEEWVKEIMNLALKYFLFIPLK
jgi:tellurite resistance-related uncharacterized protein